MPRLGSVNALAAGGLLAGALLLMACGGSTSQPQDASPQQDFAAQFDRNLGDTPQSDVLPDAPVGNHTFETATKVTVGSAAVAGTISKPGNVDYYKFDAVAGDWLRVHTEAEFLSPASDCDTVIILYDASRTQIAVDDEALPKVNNDSEIIMRVPATGTYYVTVQDISTYNTALVPRGGATYKYELTIARMNLATAGVVVDTEPNDTVAQAQPIVYFPPSASSPDYRMAYVIGVFESQADEAAFVLSVPSSDAGLLVRNATIDIMPAGSDSTDGNAYGSTTRLGEVSLTDATGATVIARIDNSLANGPSRLGPPLGPGDYLLRIKHPTTALGTNDFFVMKVQLRTENPIEAEGSGVTGVNDTLATAEALAPVDVSGGRVGYFILAHLAPADVDYFSFPVAANDKISVSCSAARAGSGLTGLQVSVRDSSDAVIAAGSATDTAGQELRITNTTPNPVGTYYLRLEASGQAAGITSDFARCGTYPAP